MAGFDFEFVSASEEEPLQRALLKWMQQSSQKLGPKLHYRKTTGGFYVSIDGPLPSMEALPVSCYSELDAITASFSAPRRLQDRRRILERILSAFEPRLEDMTQGIREITQEHESRGWTIIPRSLDFDPGSKTHLQPTLLAFRRTLIQSYTGISSRSLLEECHTVTEHLMNALLSPPERQNLSFEQKIDELARRDVFNPPGGDGDLVGGDLPGQMKELKDYRREAKHRGQVIDGDTALRLSEATTTAVHLLLGSLRRSDRDAAT